MVASDVADAVEVDENVGSSDVDESTGDESGGNETGDAKRKASGFYVPAPDVLRDRLEQEATAAGKPVAAFVRDLLAEHWGLTLPEIRSRTKYASPEERKNATKAKQQERNQLIKELLAKHRAAMEAAAASNGTAGVEAEHAVSG